MKLDNELDKLRGEYNKVKRDLAKTSADLQSEQETTASLNQKVNELLKQRDVDDSNYKQRVRDMQTRIDELEEELEDGKSNAQDRRMLETHLEEESSFLYDS